MLNILTSISMYCSPTMRYTQTPSDEVVRTFKAKGLNVGGPKRALYILEMP